MSVLRLASAEGGESWAVREFLRLLGALQMAPPASGTRRATRFASASPAGTTTATFIIATCCLHWNGKRLQNSACVADCIGGDIPDVTPMTLGTSPRCDPSPTAFSPARAGRP